MKRGHGDRERGRSEDQEIRILAYQEIRRLKRRKGDVGTRRWRDRGRYGN
jgi:hypothetical protein